MIDGSRELERYFSNGNRKLKVRILHPPKLRGIGVIGKRVCTQRCLTNSLCDVLYGLELVSTVDNGSRRALRGFRSPRKKGWETQLPKSSKCSRPLRACRPCGEVPANLHRASFSGIGHSRSPGRSRLKLTRTTHVVAGQPWATSMRMIGWI